MAKKTDELSKIIVVYSTKDADMVSSLLMMERIPCVRKKIGAGSYMNILLAMNNFGEEIYVNPEQEAEARRIVDEWKASKDKPEEAPEQMSEEDAAFQREVERADRKRGLLARIIAGILMVIFVAFYIVYRT